MIDHDTDWENLLKLLSRFKDKQFENDERVLINLSDPDYYPDTKNGIIGNNVYNLFKVFSAFNIPCEKIIFMISQYGLHEEILSACKTITDDANPTIVYTPLWESEDFPDDDTIDDLPEIENVPITHLYQCLNGIQKNHRVYFLCSIREADLLDQGIISYHFNCQ